ncbi:MAG: hypothetical protein NTAFB05_13070 [Nitrobacter sp.]|uniref:hypothetical protein n=1 Tax=Nitrobacter sp. TaxID=29420 RepID=UPI00387DF8D7
MAMNQKDLTGNSPADEGGGRRRRLLADEGVFDRRALWRLGSWGIGSIAAVTIAILAHQSGNGIRHEQIAAADLTRQSRQLQSITKANENEISRMASAIDTLNDDRDRLFARVTVLEQGLDSVTGSISRNTKQNGPPQAPSRTEAALNPPPVEPPLLPPPDFSLPAKRLAPSSESVASTIRSTDSGSSGAHPPAPGAVAAAGATPESPSSVNSPAPPGTSAATATRAAPAANPAATRLGEPDETATIAPAGSEPKNDRKSQESKKESKDAKSNDAPVAVASIPAAADAPRTPQAHVPVAHTDFGVDLGSAGSIKGLRWLWRNALKSEAKALASLHPIIVVKEGRNGIGMQLRLVAGPLTDAADAARICAVLSEKGRACETAVFEGQRLAMNEHGKGKESGGGGATKKPSVLHPPSQHRHGRRAARAEEPAPPPPPPPTPPAPQPSTSGSFFSH